MLFSSFFFVLSCFQISSRQVFGRSYWNCLRNGKDLFNWRASFLEFEISWAHHISSLPFCPIQGACWIPFFGASAIAVPSSHNSVQPLKPYETWLKNGDLKLKKNARISKGPGVMCFFLLRFCEPPFIYIYIYKHVNVLSMHHTSLSLCFYIYI